MPKKVEGNSAVARIAKRLGGGYAELGRACAALGGNPVSRSQVCNWNRPVAKGGRGGSIPDVYHKAILRYFRSKRIRLKRGELVNI